MLQNSGPAVGVGSSYFAVGVGSSFFLNFSLVEQVHHWQLGALCRWSLGWLTKSVQGQPVCAALTVNWVCLPVSFQPGWLTSNAILCIWHWEWVCYYCLPPQHLHIHPAPGYG